MVGQKIAAGGGALNPPPLPQPAAQTCPNCGAAAPEGARLCSNCGAALWVARKEGCWSVLAQILLGCLAVGFGWGGACIALLGNFESPTTDMRPILFGVLAMGFSGVCIWGIIRIKKGPR